ncbi:MAG: GNAT family N-acetyltransferase [Flavobacteriales bacterium]|nr:GNAT family N-acetyltransferase [Flavobacteriales bacterium]
MNVDEDLNWTWAAFDQLSNHQVHDLLQLRTDIFVVEQRCAYPEVDGADPFSWHLLGTGVNGQLIAYARVIPPKEGAPVIIGRVVVRQEHRGKGAGHRLMERCMQEIRDQFGRVPIRLSAQAHLTRYYEAYGFVRSGPEYPWDGIPHVDMVISATA